MLRPRLGLRRRVTLAFVALTLLLSSAVSLVLWLLLSHYVVAREEATDVTAARVTAASIDRALGYDDSLPKVVLLNVTAGQQAESLLRYRHRWYATPSWQLPGVVPDALVREVTSGHRVTQRVDAGTHTVLVVGVPVARHGGYFRLTRNDVLGRALGDLRTTLIASAVAMTVGALGIGWFASRVALRPLRELTAVAAAAARGEPGVRLSGLDDPDLAPIVRSFNETTAALEERVRADARFAGDVSHELRTPLTTMVNSLQLVQNRADQLPERVREPLAMLGEELDRFRKLVVDLIEMSRVDGRASMHWEELPAGAAVREAADAAAGRPVTTIDPSAAGVTVRVDRSRLARVVGNLVENAEQHGHGCVGVGVSVQGGRLRIEVDDAGPGIPESLRQRVFERFVRGIDGTPGGNGLGLAIVARQVHGHGGHVFVTDRPGGGARFVVSLPLLGR